MPGFIARRCCCNDQHVGLCLVHNIGKFAFILHFPDELYVGLVSDSRHNQLPHQARMICHQHTHSFHNGDSSSEHRSGGTAATRFKKELTRRVLVYEASGTSSGQTR